MPPKCAAGCPPYPARRPDPGPELAARYLVQSPYRQEFGKPEGDIFIDDSIVVEESEHVCGGAGGRTVADKER